MKLVKWCAHATAQENALVAALLPQAPLTQADQGSRQDFFLLAEFDAFGFGVAMQEFVKDTGDVGDEERRLFGRFGAGAEIGFGNGNRLIEGKDLGHEHGDILPHQLIEGLNPGIDGRDFR